MVNAADFKAICKYVYPTIFFSRSFVIKKEKSENPSFTRKIIPIDIGYRQRLALEEPELSCLLWFEIQLLKIERNLRCPCPEQRQIHAIIQDNMKKRKIADSRPCPEQKCHDSR